MRRLFTYLRRDSLLSLALSPRRGNRLVRCWASALAGVVLLLCGTGVLARAKAPHGALTAVMRTTHFIVHYDPSDPYLAKLMAGAADDALRRTSKDLGYKPEPNRPFPLYVYPTHIGFIRAGGLETSKFTVGTANSGSEAISVDASGVFELPDEVLAHEITHAVIFRLLGPNAASLPLWINEGLAKYESEEFSDADDSLVAEAAAEGSLMTLTYLTKSFPEKQSSLAYAESSSAVRYMVKRYGKSSPRVLLSELARTGSMDKAILKATGRTVDRFADEWLAKVNRKYHALSLTRAVTAIISVTMAVLVIIAFLVRRKQKIEAAKRWEQDEFEEYLRREFRDHGR